MNYLVTIERELFAVRHGVVVRLLWIQKPKDIRYLTFKAG